jgi:hypothetical protein
MLYLEHSTEVKRFWNLDQRKQIDLAYIEPKRIPIQRPNGLYVYRSTKTQGFAVVGQIPKAPPGTKPPRCSANSNAAATKLVTRQGNADSCGQDAQEK